MKIPELLRETTFRRYWSAQSISMFGDQISSLALPLVAVLALHANAAQMGFLAALVWLPSLLFGLHAGALVDRLGQRRLTMITADLGRSALLISIPVCYAAGVLTLWQLYGVAFGVGTLSVLFVVSDPALFVSLVPDDKYVSGQSLVYGSRAISFVGGPSVGGILVQLLRAPGAVIADAASYLGSAFFLARIRPAEPPKAEPGKGTLMAGARYIRSSPIVRSSLIAVRDQLLRLRLPGFVRALRHQVAAHRPRRARPDPGRGRDRRRSRRHGDRQLADRIGIGRAYTIGCLLFTAPLALVPAAAGPRPVILAMLFAAEFICGFGVMALDISVGAIFAAVIPNEMRSRVTGAFQAVNYGTRPLGALLGGLAGNADRHQADPLDRGRGRDVRLRAAPADPAPQIQNALATGRKSFAPAESPGQRPVESQAA